MNARDKRGSAEPDTEGPDAPRPRSIAPAALYEEVAERLRERIFAHEFPPGSWIDEQALAAEYGISRTPMREALKVLAAEGMVTLRPRRGSYVTEVSERDLDDIFPVLALLEARAAHEAATRASDDDLRRLEAIHTRLEQHAAAGALDPFFEANQDFHRALLEVAGNRWLGQVIQDLRRVLRLTRHHSLLAGGRVQESLIEHRELMAALRARDAAQAESRMHAHLLHGRAAAAKLRATEPAPA